MKHPQLSVTKLSLYDIFDTGEKCGKTAEKRRVFGKSLENSPKLAFYVPIFNLARFLPTI